MKINLSIVIPVSNEEKIVKKNIDLFCHYFKNSPYVANFELIVSENGSCDLTLKYLHELRNKYPNLILLTDPQKGLGLALKKAIRRAKYSYIYFDALDNPFQFCDFEEMINRINHADLVFSSKNHKKSIYRHKISRIIASKILSFLVKWIFSVSLSDTQGTFLGNKDKLLSILPLCTSKGAFFQTQIAIYATLKKYHLIEIPVNYTSERKTSQFRLIKDSLQLLREMLFEKIKLVRSRNHH